MFSVWEFKFSTHTEWRRIAHEITVPLLFEQFWGRNTSIVFGGYAGWQVSGKEENINKSSSKWIDVTKHSNYGESSRFTSDLYLGMGFLLKGDSKHRIALEPFIKYKLKDNWMGEVRTKAYFGLNIKFINLITY